MKHGRNHVNKLTRRKKELTFTEYLRWCAGRLHSMRDTLCHEGPVEPFEQATKSNMETERNQVDALDHIDVLLVQVRSIAGQNRDFMDTVYCGIYGPKAKISHKEWKVPEKRSGLLGELCHELDLILKDLADTQTIIGAILNTERSAGERNDPAKDRS